MKIESGRLAVSRTMPLTALHPDRIAVLDIHDFE
jgi:hypothetical protein